MSEVNALLTSLFNKINSHILIALDRNNIKYELTRHPTLRLEINSKYLLSVSQLLRPDTQTETILMNHDREIIYNKELGYECERVFNTVEELIDEINRLNKLFA